MQLNLVWLKFSINSQIPFLEKEILNEKVLLYIFNLFVHVE